MPELAEVQTKKTAGFVDRGYNYEKKQKKMQAEEEEIKKLEAEARGESPVDEATEETPKEEAPKEEALKEEAPKEEIVAEDKPEISGETEQ